MQHAEWRPDRMGKATIFESSRLLVGLNAFEPGQSHALHAHHGMDKVYHVLEGQGVFLLEGRELPMGAGDLLIAPEGVAHGVRNMDVDDEYIALVKQHPKIWTGPNLPGRQLSVEASNVIDVLRRHSISAKEPYTCAS